MVMRPEAKQGFSVKHSKRLSCASAVHLGGDGTGGACRGPTSTHGISHSGIKASAGSSLPGGRRESSDSGRLYGGRQSLVYTAFAVVNHGKDAAKWAGERSVRVQFICGYTSVYGD